MKESTRKPMDIVGWLAFTGLLVCLAGCAQLTPQMPASPSPISPSPISPSPISQGSFPQAAGNPVDANRANRFAATNAVDQAQIKTAAFNSAPANGAPSNVLPTAGSEPYVARQFPSQPANPGFNFTPPAGPPLPPGANFAPGVVADSGLPNSFGTPTPPPTYSAGPRVRQADLVINGFPARTGRIMLGGAVNSDAGVTGQLTIDERNFDITRWPTSFQDLFSGTAFRGAGQTFRIEAAPGTDYKRYTMQFADPNLFGYKPVSMSVSGFLYDRRFDDWDEERRGGRLAFGYRVTPDLSVTAGISGQNVGISRIRTGISPELDALEGDSELYSGEISLTHDTRNSTIMASEGHYFELTFKESFGDFDFARFDTEFRQYWTITQRADSSGRQTLSYSTKLGFSGDETPIFENYFAGGYATIRGFDFRGASPKEGGQGGVEVGGRFQWLNTLEYMFPITADDAFRGVAFVDFGTVEKNIELKSDNFRVAPGLGLRVAIPMLGPAPLAFDFAYPIAKADTDERRVFSFYMSLIR